MAILIFIQQARGRLSGTAAPAAYYFGGHLAAVSLSLVTQIDSVRAHPSRISDVQRRFVVGVVWAGIVERWIDASGQPQRGARSMPVLSVPGQFATTAAAGVEQDVQLEASGRQ
jgi:hypothetical protein